MPAPVFSKVIHNFAVINVAFRFTSARYNIKKNLCRYHTVLLLYCLQNKFESKFLGSLEFNAESFCIFQKMYGNNVFLDIISKLAT